MGIALERLRIFNTAGNTKMAETELLYLLDHLRQLHVDLERSKKVNPNDPTIHP
jgi:hypothetical protein